MGLITLATRRSIECLIDAETGRVWVNGKDGDSLGRFSVRAGVDIHRSIDEQRDGMGQCLDCRVGPASWSDWCDFVRHADIHWGIKIPVWALGSPKAWLAMDYELIQGLKESERYKHFVMTPDGAVACLAPFLYTWAIIADLNKNGYRRRWCFSSLIDAEHALHDWCVSSNAEPAAYLRRTHS